MSTVGAYRVVGGKDFITLKEQKVHAKDGFGGGRWRFFFLVRL
jgi:hypothetical protein